MHSAGHALAAARSSRAQADALIIESEAKRRLTDEYDAAQKRGEVATQSRHPGSVPDKKSAPATAADIGLSYKEIHEAREIRVEGALLKEFCSAYLHITKVNVKTHDINAI